MSDSAHTEEIVVKEELPTEKEETVEKRPEDNDKRPEENDKRPEENDKRSEENDDSLVAATETKDNELTESTSKPSIEATPPPRSVQRDADEYVYHLKWIVWRGRKTPIVMQNENGPCPLIAISNILLLRGKIYLPSVMEMVTAKQLVEYIGDAIVTSMPQGLPEIRQLNYEQNMSDAISVLPRLHTGLNVNVKFTGVQGFEYTPECIVFDLLNIPLYHGWLVDPQCVDVLSAVGSLGYNQVVEKIINNKSSELDELVTEALIAEQFLERTASQLTYHGLCELHAAMRNEELAVLFRNNHFSTILKRRNELFQLVTDQGFLHEPRVVWETLSNIDGDGLFVDGNFITVPPQMSNDNDNDCLVALSLEEEQKQLQGTVADWKDLLKQEITSHEELTQHFHEDERRHMHNSIAVGGMSHGHTRPFAHTSSGERSKKGSCGIL